jgi:Zn-dependent oligopeptidase
MASSTSGITGKSPHPSVLQELVHWYHDRYYDRVYVEKTLDLDESLVKEYFPVSVVVPTILNIYQDLLGVKFIEIKNDNKDVWHEGAWQPSYWIYLQLSKFLP